jgi:hypothetical protein
MKDSKYTLSQWLDQQKLSIQNRLDTAQKLGEFIKGRLLDFEKVYKQAIQLKQQYTLSIQYIRLEENIDQTKNALKTPRDPISSKQLENNLAVLNKHLSALAEQLNKDSVNSPAPPTDKWAPLIAPLSDSAIAAALTALQQPEQEQPIIGNLPALPSSDLAANLDPAAIDYSRPPPAMFAPPVVQSNPQQQQQFFASNAAMANIQNQNNNFLFHSPGASDPDPTLSMSYQPPAMNTRYAPPSYATLYQSPLALDNPFVPMNPSSSVNVPPPSFAQFEQSLSTAFDPAAPYTNRAPGTPPPTAPTNPDTWTQYNSMFASSPPPNPNLPMPVSPDALSALHSL